MDSENLSSLIRLSVLDGQKTDNSKVVSVIGSVVRLLDFHNRSSKIISQEFRLMIDYN